MTRVRHRFVLVRTLAAVIALCGSSMSRAADPVPTAPRAAKANVQELKSRVDAMHDLSAAGKPEEALGAGLEAVAMLESLGGGADSWMADLLSDIGTVRAKLGQSDAALQDFQRAIAISEAINGPDHRKTARHLITLADRYRAIERSAEAIPLYRRALAIHEALDGIDQPDDGDLLNSLALACREADRHAEALPLFRRELAIEERRNPDSGSTAVVLYNLAATHRAMHQPDEALPLYRRALALRERVSGSDSPAIEVYLTGLAGLYQETGHPADALPLRLRALDIAKRTHGPESAETAVALNQVANLHSRLGQVSQSLPYFEQALAADEKADGPQGAETGTALFNVGYVLNALKRYPEAVPLLERAVAIAEKNLGAGTPGVRTRLEALATAYRNTDQAARAIPLFEESLRIARRAEPVDPRMTYTSGLEIADAMSAAGRLDEALTMLEKVRTSNPPPDPADLRAATVRFNIAQAYAARNRRPQAIAVMQDVLVGLRASRGEDDDSARNVMDRLGDLQFVEGHYLQALDLQQRALRIAQDKDGATALSLCPRLSSVGLTYQLLGQTEQALPLFERQVAIAEAAGGDGREALAAGLLNKGRLLRLQGHPADGLSLMLRSLAIADERAPGDGGGLHPVIWRAIGEARLQMGEQAEAEKALATALAQARKAWGEDDDVTGRAMGSLALAELRANRTDRALPLLQRFDEIATASADRDGQWRAARAMARLRLALNDTHGAIAWGEKGVAAIQSLRLEIAERRPDWQAAYLQDKRDVYEALARAYAEAGDPAAAARMSALLNTDAGVPAVGAK